MKYIPRQGIVLTKICDVDMLIPMREAYPYCKTVQRLPPLWAATWNAFRDSVPIAESARIHSLVSSSSLEECEARIRFFCDTMCERGFMKKVPDEENKDGI